MLNERSDAERSSTIDRKLLGDTAAPYPERALRAFRSVEFGIEDNANLTRAALYALVQIINPRFPEQVGASHFPKRLNKSGRELLLVGSTLALTATYRRQQLFASRSEETLQPSDFLILTED